ncbi:LamG-like jellyroll fold domain-containing protein [Motilimonas pumila]|uniref:LamG-like jellyroll fold domain-containing protein n=1 Tax=Motilimonas pumila TaxID=2303987 RepID=UPI001313E23A|nr:LamG-like jellyroll fold domain-containing protein [Motilimonas pumila]
MLLKLKSLILASCSTLCFNATAQTDYVSLDMAFSQASAMESEAGVEINAGKALISAVKLIEDYDFTKDPDVISYLPMNAYDTNSYNYQRAPKVITETYNLVNAFDNAKASNPEGINLGAGKKGNGLTFSGGFLRQGLYGLQVGEARKTGFSYSVWVKPDDLSVEAGLISSGAYFRHTTSLRILSSGVLSFSYASDEGASVTVTGTTALKSDQWQHVTAVYDPVSKSSKIYLNGDLEASVSADSPFGVKGMGVSLLVGTTPSTNSGHYYGAMDELVVYKRALSAEKVQEIFQGAFYRGEVVYKAVPLPKSNAENGAYNTLKVNIDETRPGSTKVSVWQNERWHLLTNSYDAIFDMPVKMPLTELKYKLELVANTSISSVNFELSNQDYIGTKNKFSFIFMGDDNGHKGHSAIADARKSIDDLKMVFTVPDNGWGSGLADNYRSYTNAWMNHPTADSRFVPIFNGLGNHDIEVPTDVHYASKVLGEQVASALPGMRNYLEGPYDTYANGYKDTKLTYSFDYQNAYFMVLNGYFRDKDVPTGDGKFHDRTDPYSYSPFSHVSEDMLTWLEQSLSTTQAEHKFIFFHEGAFPPPGQRHFGDSLDNSKAPGNSGPDNTRPMRDRFWTLLAKYQVTATMMGHNHTSSQTWVADPSGVYAAVYELEPGYILSTKKYAHVAINQSQVTVKYIESDRTTGEFAPFTKDLVIDRSVSGKHSPVIKQYKAKAESGYIEIDKQQYKLEVGGSIQATYNDLYFEVKDNDINDLIEFSVDGLPTFLQVNEITNAAGVNQFRRISLSTKRAVIESDLGSYPITVKASDGVHQVAKSVTLDVIPAMAPTILGSNIINGAEYEKVRDVFFFCKDNSGVSNGRIYNQMAVTWNGKSLRQAGISGEHSGWRPRGYLPFGSEFMFTGIQFKEDKVPPGEYTIAATCVDIYGATSAAFNLNFTVVDSGLDLAQEKPWTDIVYPLPGTVENIDRINIWLRANNAKTNSARRDLVYRTLDNLTLTNSGGEPVVYQQLNSIDNPYDISIGTIEILTDNLADDVYTLSLAASMSAELTAERKSYEFKVVNGAVVESNVPSAPTWLGLEVEPIYFANLDAVQVKTVNKKRILSWAPHPQNQGVNGYYIYKNNTLLAILGNVDQYEVDLTQVTEQDVFQVIPYNASSGKTARRETVVTPEPTKPSAAPVPPSPPFDGRERYVDGSLSADCFNQYDLKTRQCASGQETAFKTIFSASEWAEPGDKISIRQGHYSETIMPQRSGAPGKEITYSAYEQESVVIGELSGAMMKVLPAGEYHDMSWLKVGIYIWEKSYIHISGITFKDMDAWARLVRANHITLKNNRFLDARAPGNRASIKLIDSHYNAVVDNIIHRGHDNVFLLASDHNDISGNDIQSGRHTLWTIKSGNHNFIRNNYFHNELEKIGEVMDANDPVYGEDEPFFNLTSTNDAHFNVIENNVFAYTPASSNNPYQGIQYAGQDGVIRNNVFYQNAGTGIELTSYQYEATFTSRNRIYHNVFYKNHFGGMTVSGNQAHQFQDNIMKNNLFEDNDFQDHRREFLSWMDFDGKPVQLIVARSTDVSFMTNNVYSNAPTNGYDVVRIYPNDETPRPEVSYSIESPEVPYQQVFTDNLGVPSLMVDPASYDFRLSPSSPLIDAASFLTTASSTGSGHTINVHDTRYFVANSPVYAGDTIQLEGTSSQARVLHIEHDSNQLTLDQPLSWTYGQGISLPYHGSKPDIGAFESNY